MASAYNSEQITAVLKYAYKKKIKYDYKFLDASFQKAESGNSLAVQWLGLHAFTVVGHGFYLWSGN